MIERENFKIIEPDDIVAACDHIEEAGPATGNLLLKINGDGMGAQDRDDFLGELLIVLCAAGVGAAMCKFQGGIVALKEGAPEEDKQEAVRLLKELHQKNRPAPAATMQEGILQ